MYTITEQSCWYLVHLQERIEKERLQRKLSVSEEQVMSLLEKVQQLQASPPQVLKVSVCNNPSWHDLESLVFFTI